MYPLIVSLRPRRRESCYKPNANLIHLLREQTSRKLIKNFEHVT